MRSVTVRCLSFASICHSAEDCSAEWYHRVNSWAPDTRVARIYFGIYIKDKDSMSVAHKRKTKQTEYLLLLLFACSHGRQYCFHFVY